MLSNAFWTLVNMPAVLSWAAGEEKLQKIVQQLPSTSQEYKEAARQHWPAPSVAAVSLSLTGEEECYPSAGLAQSESILHG